MKEFDNLKFNHLRINCSASDDSDFCFRGRKLFGKLTISVELKNANPSEPCFIAGVHKQEPVDSTVGHVIPEE